jgi:hypothetical protein
MVTVSALLLVQVRVELPSAVTVVGSADIVTEGEGFVLILGVMTKNFPDFHGNTTAAPETGIAEEMKRQLRMEMMNSSVVFFTRSLEVFAGQEVTEGMIRNKDSNSILLRARMSIFFRLRKQDDNNIQSRVFEIIPYEK